MLLTNALPQKILIANRGEIAIKIAQCCNDMGIEAHGLYTVEDEKARHLSFMVQSHKLSSSQLSTSYLDKDQIIQIAVKHKIEAIHPGYGFLSENSDFSAACEKAGIIFVGPSSKIINLMASKKQAKALAKSLKIPVLPEVEVKDLTALEKTKEQANTLGYPLVIKASSGGGGRGMRIVSHEKNLLKSLEESKRESKRHFKDDDVFLEPYFSKIKHIEVQIACDHTGQVVHYFTRDCSIQRRFQKIIEEAPASLDKKIEQDLYDSSIKIAREINYQGLGTIEFIVDLKDPKNPLYFFLEMNTRLQVEHPVTEMICSQDLIQLQINLHMNHNLPQSQKEITKKGHSIEVRINSEDPFNEFLPSAGEITKFFVEENSKLKVYSAVCNNSVIGTSFDPLIAKIVSSGETREDARRTLMHNLKKTTIHGIKSNLAFVIRCLQEDSFIALDYNTHFIENHKARLLETNSRPSCSHEVLISALCLKFFRQEQNKTAWKEIPANWSNTSKMVLTTTIRLNNKETKMFYQVEDHKTLTCSFEDESLNYTVKLIDLNKDKIILELNHKRFEVSYSDSPTHIIETETLFLSSYNWQIYGTQEVSYKNRFEVGLENQTLQKEHMIPMPGKILNLFVKKGDKVNVGDKLIAIESMKMEQTLESFKEGVVKGIFVRKNEVVSAQKIYIEIEGEN